MKLKNNGLEEQTVKVVGFYLNHLAVNVDMQNPEMVKEFIAGKNVNSGFKGNLVKAYNYYTLINGIVWERPRYRWEQNKPKTPSEETLNKIIASCGWKYSVVFPVERNCCLLETISGIRLDIHIWCICSGCSLV